MLLAFVGLGIAALVLQWRGILLGAALLAWGVAGATGKVKGPMSLVFHDSTKAMALTVLSLMLGGMVMTCGVMGTVAESNRVEREARQTKENQEREAKDEAEREQRAAEEAAARTAHESELRGRAAQAATDYIAGLDAVDALIASGQWPEAGIKLKEVTDTVAEYKALSPVPEELAASLLREAKLALQIDAQRREREAAAWIERAQAVVSDKGKCETREDVEEAMVQVEGLQASDPGHTIVQELNDKLLTCLDDMPPPSAWTYDLRKDPMGGTNAFAAVSSSNTFEFDFPYQGAQNAMLMIRNDGGLDVMLSVEKGQFMCTLGCSVLVRFDDGKMVRWRATDTADHSTTTVFLRRESAFVKALSKARVVRIEAIFFQEGTRVLEFPVARFDVNKLKG